MSIQGIDQITYGVEDLATCRQFWLDWGLSLVGEADARLVFESLNGSRVVVCSKDDPALPPAFEPASTLREVVWGVQSAVDLKAIKSKIIDVAGFTEHQDILGCTDPNQLAIKFQITRKRQIKTGGVPINTWDNAERINRPSAFYERAQPVEVGHVVVFTDCLDEMENFYHEHLGFEASDRYPGRGVFMRCAPEGGHHDLFILQTPERQRGLNHVAFTVRDIHEVFGGGLHISRCGWETQLGPGRHPISSAYFWYFKNPCGGLVEYYSDEDVLTAEWKPRELESIPENFAEWAISGGIDGHTRRQRVK